MKKLELLAPAGSIEALEAAVESGADAVYLGGSKFNARAYADNLDKDMLKKAVEYAHIRGVKVYITVNILILQRELDEVMEYIKYLYSINVDAVIVQDIGLAAMIKKMLPDFDVHCSTQMAIHNTDGAALLKEMGINRVVLARELSLKEVDDIVGSTGVEAEIFVHGALCVCYSGQCYMSSLIGGRSGNRGKCAQPCRKKYRLYDTNKGKEIRTSNGQYLISTRDLNTYERLYEIAASKAASLKIEGRMKRPEYVSIIVHNYKEALNCIEEGKGNCISKEAAYELRIAFNREFTQGYLFNKRNQEIVSTERPDNRGIYIGKVLSQHGNIAELLIEDNFLNDGDGIEIINEKGQAVGCTVSGIKKGSNTVKSAKAGDKVKIYVTGKAAPGSIVNKTLDSKLFQKAREEYAYRNKRKINITGIFTGKINAAPVLEIQDDSGNYVKVVGSEEVQQAQKLAVTEEKIFEQLNKTKDTPYVFEKLDIHIDENSFLSVKAINTLRREALEQLSAKRTEVHGRKLKLIDVKEEVDKFIAADKSGCNRDRELIAGIRSAVAGKSALKAGADSLYIIGDYRYDEQLKLIEELTQYCSQGKSKLFYMMPQITRNNELRAIEGMLQKVLQINENLGLVISNISHLKAAQRLQCRNIRGNFTLNAINSAAAMFFKDRGLNSLCVSPELNLKQIKDMQQASDIALEAVVYGYLPAMITEHCPHAAAPGCDFCCGSCSKSYGMVDERNKLFRVINMGSGKNTILNSDVLCIYYNLSNVVESGISKFRLDFYIEDENQVYELVKAYSLKLDDLKNSQEIPVIEQLKKHGFTKGHYFRGIE